jgi:hypothetical protein
MWGALSDSRTGLSFTFAAGSPQRSFLGFESRGDSFNLSGQVPVFKFLREQPGPIIPPVTGFPFLRLIELAGLLWRYPYPPPHGLNQDQRFTANQFVLERIP